MNSVSERAALSASRWTRVRSWLSALSASPVSALVWSLGALFCLLRFVALDRSPPGFFSDEFRAALHHICLAERGVSGYGEPWPTFVPGAGGGLYTPPFLYIGAAWVKLFGPTIVSCRALAATFTLLATLATTAVARRTTNAQVARWTFLAAALSPWAFQFARIAWDPPMAPAFVMWAIFFWLGRARRIELVLSAVLFGLALHSYPPTRVQAPLLFLLLGLWALRRRSLKVSDVVLFGVVAALVAWPVLQGTLDGTLNRRGNGEAIFNKVFIANARGHYAGWFFVLQALLDNLAAHFHPTFVFLTGDRNLRHSTQYFGVFSLLDDLALSVIVFIGARAVLRRAAAVKQGNVEPRAPESVPPATPAAPCPDTSREWRLAAFAVMGYLAGVLPAALCWSGVPHALRAIGAWPFLALGTGLVLNAASRSVRRFSLLALAVAGAHAVLFAYIFFVRYPKLPNLRDWYDGHVNDVMLDRKFEPGKNRAFLSSNPEGFRYYAIAYRGETCESSDRILRRYTGNGDSSSIGPGRVR